jgi:Potassium-transporting ATPase A subunit
MGATTACGQEGRRADGSSPPVSTVSIDVHGLLQEVCVLGGVYVPLGDYLAHVYTARRYWRVEAVVYRVCGIDPDAEQRWKHYLISLQSTLGHCAQAAGLGVEAFASAAVGLAAGVALIRGLARHRADTMGNFWDLIRSITRVLLPLPFLFAIVLVGLGVIQNLSAPQNPTPLSNIVEIVLMLLIPTAFIRTFDTMIGDHPQGWALLAVIAATAASEGTETHCGVPASAAFGVAATATANGAANSSYDSFTWRASHRPLFIGLVIEVALVLTALTQLGRASPGCEDGAVDDESQLLRALRINLRARAYEVETAQDGGRGGPPAPRCGRAGSGSARHRRHQGDHWLTRLDPSADDYITKLRLSSAKASAPPERHGLWVKAETPAANQAARRSGWALSSTPGGVMCA